MVTNTFSVQIQATAVCGRYAVLVGRLFIEESSVEGLLKRLRGVFGEDNLANYQKVLDLVPLTTGGGSDEFEAEEKPPTTHGVEVVASTKHGRVYTDGSVAERLAELYYSPAW